MFRLSTPRVLLGSVIALALGAGAAVAQDAADKPTTQPAYPLTTCVVSGEELGGMGEPHILTYEGREVRLCCKSCEKAFNKDPQKYLKKIDEAQKQASATTQPSDAHDHAH